MDIFEKNAAHSTAAGELAYGVPTFSGPERASAPPRPGTRKHPPLPPLPNRLRTILQPPPAPPSVRPDEPPPAQAEPVTPRPRLPPTQLIYSLRLEELGPSQAAGIAPWPRTTATISDSQAVRTAAEPMVDPTLDPFHNEPDPSSPIRLHSIEVNAVELPDCPGSLEANAVWVKPRSLSNDLATTVGAASLLVGGVVVGAWMLSQQSPTASPEPPPSGNTLLATNPEQAPGLLGGGSAGSSLSGPESLPPENSALNGPVVNPPISDPAAAYRGLLEPSTDLPAPVVIPGGSDSSIAQLRGVLQSRPTPPLPSQMLPSPPPPPPLPLETPPSNLRLDRPPANLRLDRPQSNLRLDALPAANEPQAVPTPAPSPRPQGAQPVAPAIGPEVGAAPVLEGPQPSPTPAPVDPVPTEPPPTAALDDPTAATSLSQGDPKLEGEPRQSSPEIPLLSAPTTPMETAPPKPAAEGLVTP